MEIEKMILNSSSGEQLFFFRDSNGREVDLIWNRGNMQIPVEIKSAQTISSDFTKGLSYWQNLQKTANSNSHVGQVIYDGDDVSLGEFRFINWKKISWFGQKT